MPGKKPYDGSWQRKRRPASVRPATPFPSGAAAVGAGEDFKVVAIRVFPIQATAAVIAIDLAWPVMSRIGPILQVSRADAFENHIKLRFADDEGIVVPADVVAAHVVQRDAI